MRKKVAGVLLGVTISIMLLAGCTSDGGSTDETGTEKERITIGKVGISMPTRSQERWNRDSTYLDEHFKAAGYGTLLAFSDNDVKQQVDDIQEMLDNDVDLLIVTAVDNAALDTVLDKALEANVPVIAYDRLIKNDAVSYYVSFDSYAIGKLQGEYIVDNLHLDDAGDKVYNLEIAAGESTDNNSEYLYNGAMDVLNPYIETGTLKVVSGQSEFSKVVTERWNMDDAFERAQNILSTYYADGTPLDAWLCPNDSIALGVAHAITSDYKGTNTVLVTGQDGDEANLKNIVDGIQSMTVYKDVSNEAVVTLSLAQNILEGKAIDESLVDPLEIECIYDTESYETSERNKCHSFILMPKVITKDNLQDLIDTGKYKMSSDGYLFAKD